MVGALARHGGQAVRAYARRPGFTAVAVLTLALGIGATSAIFSVVNGILLLPLPFPEPERLVWIEARSGLGHPISVSIPNFFSWEESTRAFEAMGGFRLASANLTGVDRPERLEATMVLGDLFGALGRRPVLGRVFAREETLRGAERLAVLSHGLWQRRFGAEPDVVGRTILLDGEPFRVIGVMPPDFTFPLRTEVWVPMGVYASILPWDNRGNSPGMYVVARTKEGVAFEQAAEDLAAAGARVREATGSEVEPVPRPLREVAVGDVEGRLWVALAAVGLLLLIACANVANLLLARADERRREMAVRAALGAGRRVLVGQLLLESVLLALVGAAGGVLLAHGGVEALVAMLPSDLPLVDRIALDGRVLAVTAAVAVATGLLFGLAPALFLGRVDPGGALKEGGRGLAGDSRAWLRNGLVVVEVAMAVVLLVAAGLLLRSFERLRTVDPGFRTEGVLTVRVSLPSSRYPDLGRWSRFYRELVERVAGLPGVDAAAVNNGIPLVTGGTESSALPEGRPVERESIVSCLYQTVSPDYFRVLRIPLLRGRFFTDRDDADAEPVAIVDETMARTFWPGEDPIGRRVAFEFEGSPEAPRPLWRRVVGVVGHVRHYELRSPSRVEIYVPYTQPPVWFERRRPNMALFVKTELPPADLVPALRSELAAIDPDVPLYGAATMDEILREEVGTDRMLSGVLGAFAAASVFLAAVGLYGVLAFWVSRRTHEIGVRMALGATVRDIASSVLGRSAVVVGAGLLLGLLAAVAAGRALAAVLFETDPHDPTTFLGVALLLALVSLPAVLAPTRRAASVDPVVALRYE